MSFTGAATAARDSAFDAFARPVVIDPDGAATTATAIVMGASVTETFAEARIREPARTMRFKASEAPVEGTVVALMTDDAATEIERRVVQGEPAFVDGRRLVVDVDTRPA